MPETIIVFIFGTIIGSFINALAFRHNTGKSMWGRSACTSCNTQLRSQDLVPVLSYVFLGGRCRTCRASISLQYPLVEILAGVLSVAAFSVGQGPMASVFSFGFFMLLLFIAVYDFRHTIIPDQFVFAAGALSLSMHAASGMSVASFVSFAIAGPILALPLFLIWFFSKGRAMGLGDAKLMCAIGFFLGLSAGFAALVVSFWVGAAVGVLLLIYSRTKGQGGVTMRSEVPFGPFLVLAAALAYFFNLTYASLLLFS